MGGVGYFVLAVLALHFLHPDLSVMDDQMSYYALEEFGWLMRSAFAAVGIGTIAIGWGLNRTLEPGKRVKASVVMVLIAGVAFVLAGVFNSDPIGETEMSTVGTVHGVASLVVFVFLLIAAWMLRGVFSRDESWRGFARTQLWLAVALTVTFFVVFATPEDGSGGLTQRVFVAVMMTWLALLGWRIREVGASHTVT